MKIEFLNLDRQWDVVGSKVKDNIDIILQSRKYIKGQFTEQFEKQWANANDAKYSVSTTNGTTALEIALRVNELRHNHRIVTVPNTFIATVEAIYNIGAKPAFVDVEKDTGLMDMDKLETLLKNDIIDAVIPVHLFGQSCDMTRLVELEEEYSFKIIQDGCQAHLAKHDNNQLVKYGTVCNSFYPGKNLGGITDGGAIVTNNEHIYDMCKMSIDHGRIKEDKYHHRIFGTNARMSEINASALLAKLPYLKQWNSRRREIAKIYDNAISDTIIEKNNNISSYHLYVIKSKIRDTLKLHMENNGIKCGIHYPQLIPTINERRFPIANVLRNEILSIPMCPYMTTDEIEYVISIIKNMKV